MNLAFFNTHVCIANVDRSAFDGRMGHAERETTQSDLASGDLKNFIATRLDDDLLARSFADDREIAIDHQAFLIPPRANNDLTT